MQAWQAVSPGAAWQRGSFDLEAVGMDVAHPFRCQIRVCGKVGHRSGARGVGVGVQDRAQQALEGLVVYLLPSFGRPVADSSPVQASSWA